MTQFYLRKLGRNRLHLTPTGSSPNYRRQLNYILRNYRKLREEGSS